jgi:hypothetical protein
LNENDEEPDFDNADYDDGEGEEVPEEEDHHHSIISELCDPSWSTPTTPDAHDQLMQQFFTFKYADLPADYPARHMHIIDWRAYINSNDRIVEYVRPRLCDGIATLLFETSRKCLDEFLDPEVGMLEWRRTGGQADRNSSAVVRRVGGRVYVSF